MDPKGKVALITGGARIGQVVADALAKRGCGLAIVYRASRDAAEKTVAAAKAAGVNAIAVQADARNADQIEAAVNETVKSLGRLDILINMAVDLHQDAKSYRGGLDRCDRSQRQERVPVLDSCGAHHERAAARGASSISPIGCRSAGGLATKGMCLTTLRRRRWRR